VGPGGRVVTAGVSEGNRVAVAALQANGQRDTSFGDQGLATFAPADVDFEPYPVSAHPGFPRLMENVYAADVAVDGDGRILVVGGSRRVAGGDVDAWVARLTPSGALDPSFGSGGIAWLDLAGGDEWGLAVA